MDNRELVLEAMLTVFDATLFRRAGSGGRSRSFSDPALGRVPLLLPLALEGG